jgi:hypothetical protein
VLIALAISVDAAPLALSHRQRAFYGLQLSISLLD